MNESTTITPAIMPEITPQIDQAALPAAPVAQHQPAPSTDGSGANSDRVKQDFEEVCHDMDQFNRSEPPKHPLPLTAEMESKIPKQDPDCANEVVLLERITFSQHPHALPVNELMPEFQEMSEFAEQRVDSTVMFGRIWLRTTPAISPGCPDSCFLWSLSLRQDGERVEMISCLVSVEELPGSLKSRSAPPTFDDCRFAASDRKRFLAKLIRLLQIDPSTLNPHPQPESNVV